MNKIDRIIKQLDLQPHPEGGFYKETYRSTEIINTDSLNNQYVGPRNISTCIYFLLRSTDFSAFHKITQDEIWHYYDGSAIVLHIISPAGEYSQHILGKDIFNGQVPQFVVPGQHWFAATVINKEDYALFGCTVSPGFDFADFILAEQLTLMTEFPQHEEIITELTH